MNSGLFYTLSLLLIHKGIFTIEEVIKAQYAAEEAYREVRGNAMALNAEDVLNEEVCRLFSEEMNNV